MLVHVEWVGFFCLCKMWKVGYKKHKYFCSDEKKHVPIPIY